MGNNVPVFFIQDAIKFPDLIHAVKMEPDRGFPQAASAHDTFWDFISLTPEAMHMVMWIMSDRTLARSLRMIEGFGVHSFRLIDAQGNPTFVKFHWRPKLGMQSTGNSGGAHNLVVHSTGETFADLLKTMDRGLVIADLMGSGVNPVTGDYSRGASGFWVENGKIQYPVTEITIAGNLKDMFQGILGIGSDVDRRGAVLTGSILLEQMSIGGS